MPFYRENLPAPARSSPTVAAAASNNYSAPESPPVSDIKDWLRKNWVIVTSIAVLLILIVIWFAMPKSSSPTARFAQYD